MGRAINTVHGFGFFYLLVPIQDWGKVEILLFPLSDNTAENP